MKLFALLFWENFSLIIYLSFSLLGVLDPVELSMISGSFSKSKGEALSAIQEEDTNCDSNPSNLQTLEENLFKQLPVKTSEMRNNGGSLLLKKRKNEAPTSVVSLNIEVLIFLVMEVVTFYDSF